ncbi:unnamed protein product [Parnassius apollo]|uniref:(apollo) hypothetical protein n=1 Tax=Parnassius apollo TaxID=110799 RepID=A0A8S3XVF2_PARAO|nr:unnamed protein product [Parnassius apollo]
MTALDPNSTDIYYDSWIDNVYHARPDELQDMNLFDFSKDYDLVNTRPVSNKVEYYVLANKKYLKKRDRPYLINHYLSVVEQMPAKYFFSLLLLFKPWRILDDLKMQHETYTETSNAVKDDLQEALRYGNLRTELRNILQTAFEKVEEKVAELNEERENLVDEGPDNPLEFAALVAVNAMEDLNNFDLVEEDISEMNEQAMIDKLNSDQKKVFDTVTNKIRNQKEIFRHFVSGTGGTGKSL